MHPILKQIRRDAGERPCEVMTGLKRYEGFRGDPYNDSVGKPTIGYGTLLPLSEDEAEMLAWMRLHTTVAELMPHVPDGLHPDAREVLVDMAYNLGVPRLLKFVRMWEALHVHDYAKAADEMVDSRWHTQVGRRAEELVKEMRACA